MRANGPSSPSAWPRPIGRNPVFKPELAEWLTPPSGVVLGPASAFSLGHLCRSGFSAGKRMVGGVFQQNRRPAIETLIVICHVLHTFRNV